MNKEIDLMKYCSYVICNKFFCCSITDNPKKSWWCDDAIPHPKRYCIKCPRGVKDAKCVPVLIGGSPIFVGGCVELEVLLEDIKGDNPPKSKNIEASNSAKVKPIESTPCLNCLDGKLLQKDEMCLLCGRIYK